MANCGGCNEQTVHGHCPHCDANQMARNNYFTGKLLVERDFTDEQHYHIGKDRRHNKHLHGVGVVCGLKVRQHRCPDQYVVVEPGTAVDCCGREILVEKEQYFDFRAHFRALWQKQHGPAAEPDDQPHTIQICLRYAECPTEEVPALFDDCGCDDTGSLPNRILETFALDLLIDPELPVDSPASVALAWTHTVNVADARRVARDETAERLYVVTAADPATLYIFEAQNHNLTGAHSLPGAAGDLVLAPSGDHIYVSLPDEERVQVLSTGDLGTPAALVNELTLTGSAGEDVPLALSPSGDRLYALNVATAELLAWDDPAGATPGALPGAATGAAPRAIAVDPDGLHVFVANSGDGTISVFDAGDLAATPTTVSIAGAAPSALATAGTTAGPRLYVADADNGRVQMFEAAAPFDALGAAQNIDPGGPVALVPSPGGRWLYVLLDNAGSGAVRAVDTHRLELGQPAIATMTETGRQPSDLLLDASGRRLYVAFGGAEIDGVTGGVAVVEVRQEPCAGIFERALDACPTCDGEDCLVLGTVRDYVYNDDVTDADIDNWLGRRLLPSTELITEVLRCLLERDTASGAEGEQGPPGEPGSGISTVDVTFVDCALPGSSTFDPDTETLTLNIPRGCDGEGGLGIEAVSVTFVPCEDPGSATIQDVGGQRTLVLEIPRGCDGEQGEAGPGIDDVELDLVPCDEEGKAEIVVTADGQRVLVLTLPSGCAEEETLTHICNSNWTHGGIVSRQALFNPGLLLGLDRPVQASFINAHTFQLFVRRPRTDDPFGFCLDCWCEVNLSEEFGGYVGGARGVSVKGDPESGRCTITVEGDLPIPERQDEVVAAWLRPSPECAELFQNVDECRVVFKGDLVADVEGKGVDANHLPPWLPAQPTGDGVEGGTFESYFRLGREGIVNVNTAGESELVGLPGIGPDLARAILALRMERAGFDDVEELKLVSGIGDNVLDGIRSRIRL